MSKVFGFFADVYMFLYERNKVPFYLKTVTSIRFLFFNLHVIWLMNVAKKYLCRVYTYIYGNWSSNNDSHLQSRYINLNHIHFNRKCLSAISKLLFWSCWCHTGIWRRPVYFTVGHADIGYKTSMEFVQMYAMPSSFKAFWYVY